MVTVAQRYSLLVRARNDTSANYAIHANMDIDMFDTVPDALNPNITSSITYSTSASLTNNPIVDEYPDVNDTALVPLDVIPQFAPADKTIELEVRAPPPLFAKRKSDRISQFSFDTMNDGTNRAMFNQRTYTYPNVPPVLSALTLGPNATVETAYGPLTEVVDHLDSFELFVKNADAGKHPLFVSAIFPPRTLFLTFAQPSSRPQIPDCSADRQLLVRGPFGEPSLDRGTREPGPSRHG
jgi:iron transport multicopper oxidase